MVGAVIETEVVDGQHLGRKLGFPTANMDIAGYTELVQGVYLSEAIVEGRSYYAMSNIGIRPSVNGTRRWLETHLFDFDGDLYGKKLAVRLLEKIRDERKFSSLDALKEQLALDRAYCIASIRARRGEKSE